MGKHPSKKLRWKLKNIFNWFQKRRMKKKGRTPFLFNCSTNSYTYMETEELESLLQEQTKNVADLETVPYNGPRNISHGIQWRKT